MNVSISCGDISRYTMAENSAVRKAGLAPGCAANRFHIRGQCPDIPVVQRVTGQRGDALEMLSIRYRVHTPVKNRANVMPYN